MNIWVLLALIAVLFLVWLVVSRPCASRPATSLGAELIGPSPQREDAR
jgi:hypothetical protein